jgi:hypothetical protein
MKKHYQDFELYSRALIETRDVDPTYPVVDYIIKHYGFEPMWFVFMYVSFYSLESAIQICEKMPTSKEWSASKFETLRGKIKKFGIERRGKQRRVEVQVESLEAIIDFINDLQHDLDMTLPFDVPPIMKSNAAFKQALKQLPNYGGWAAFKTAELFEKALYFESVAVPDLGLEGRDPNSNDGPVGGLRWLFGREEEFNRDWFGTWTKFGEGLSNAWGVDMGKVETCFCKWHKVVTGKYFVGHDIQEFVELQHVMDQAVYEDMMSMFHPRIWEGKKHMDKQLKKAYKETGTIVNSDLVSDLPRIDVLDILLDTPWV